MTWGKYQIDQVPIVSLWDNIGHHEASAGIHKGSSTIIGIYGFTYLLQSNMKCGSYHIQTN